MRWPGLRPSLSTADSASTGPHRAEPGHGWAVQGKGRALWCVGKQLYKVQTVLQPIEQALTIVTMYQLGLVRQAGSVTARRGRLRLTGPASRP